MSASMTRRSMLGAAALALLRPSRLWARVGAAPLAELLAHSDCCVVARSLAATSSFRVLGGARRIVTLHRLRVDEALDGPVRAGDELTLRTLGGRVGDLAQRVFGEAELAIDEPALLFLFRADAAEFVVTDLAGGCLALDRDARGVTRVRIARPEHAVAAPADGAAAQLAGATMPEVQQLLLAARGQHAR